MGQDFGERVGEQVPIRVPRRDERHTEQELSGRRAVLDLRRPLPVQRVRQDDHPERHQGGHLPVGQEQRPGERLHLQTSE